MADITIPGLPALATIDQQPSDVYEMSDSAGALPSKKETRNQQLIYTRANAYSGGTDISVNSITGVIASTAPPEVVESWDGSTTPVDVIAGTGIDITGGVITNTAASTTPDASYGEMYFSGNVTPTTIVTPGVPVKINATYISGDLLNFTQGTGTLTCTNTATVEYRVSVSASGTMDLASDTVQLSIFHNGSIVTKSEITYSLDGISPSFKALPIQAGISIALGDTIEVYIANLTSTNFPTVDSLNCLVTSIGGSNNFQDQVVVAWDGSITPVSVTAGTDIDITAGVISYTGDTNVTLQDVYDNSVTGDTIISTGKPATWSSTTEGNRTPSMTQAQSNAIVSPLNGLEVWQNNTNRKAMNAGTPGSPDWQQVAWLTDITASTGQSAIYIPTFSAVLGCGGLSNNYSGYSTISTVAGTICTVFINMLYTPTASVATFQASIPFGAVFTTAQQASFTGGTSYVTSTQLNPSVFKNLQSNPGTTNIVLGIQVPGAAFGVANTLAFSFSYVIQ